MIKEEELCNIGFFAKPHGVKGEIALVTDYDITGISGDPCIVCSLDDIWTPFFITSCRQKNASTTLVSFDNLDSAEKVKFLSGKTAWFRVQNSSFEGDRTDVSNTLFESDRTDVSNTLLKGSRTDVLNGYTVIDERHGTLGHVKDVDARTLNILLTVDYKGNEILIPLALATSITHKQKTVNLSLPDGFLDIYV